LGQPGGACVGFQNHGQDAAVATLEYEVQAHVPEARRPRDACVKSFGRIGSSGRNRHPVTGLDQAPSPPAETISMPEVAGESLESDDFAAAAPRRYGVRTVRSNLCESRLGCICVPVPGHIDANHNATTLRPKRRVTAVLAKDEIRVGQNALNGVNEERVRALSHIVVATAQWTGLHQPSFSTVTGLGHEDDGFLRSQKRLSCTRNLLPRGATRYADPAREVPLALTRAAVALPHGR